MAGKILILQGHPDSGATHFGHALAAAYAQGARDAGREVRELRLASLDIALLRSPEAWQHDAPAPDIARAQEAIAWCNHLVLVFPLWLGTMPALVKAFCEQVFRPGFAIDPASGAGLWKKKLGGRSARIVVTMGMPAIAFTWFFRAHGVKALTRNILGFVGFGPIRTTYVGGVGELTPTVARRWKARLAALGEAGR